MINFNVILSNFEWEKYIKKPNSFIEKKLEIINKKDNSFKKKVIFCTLLLSGNNEIKKLNKKFRNKNKSTDVLSFPFYTKSELKKKLKREKEIYLGDIIININKVKNRSNKNLFKHELNKLWIHGLTHLFGYDHKQDKDFYDMSKVEKKFLSYLKK